jgi:uncharacterized protein YllA (UPF0747 family)
MVMVDATDPELRAVVRQPDRDAVERTFDALRSEQARLLSEAGYHDPATQDAGRWTSDPLVMNLILPGAANVVDPDCLAPFSLLVRYFSEQKMRPPVVWPSMSATIVDARSRKTLDKYGFGFDRLFLGAGALLEEVENHDGQAEASAGFDTLLSLVNTAMDELKGLVPSGDQLAAVVDDARAKIAYQVTRIQERYAAARKTRLEAAGRQIERLCNSLAPGGKLQERYLSGIHFVLRHSRTILRDIHDKADPAAFNHQLIFVD